MRLIQGAGVVVAFAVALAVPALAPDPATTNIAVFTMMYIGLATAWNIMGGYTGYISLGHAGFFGFGAYALGLLLAHFGVAGGYSPFLLVPVAGVLTAVLALGIGWFALRTRAATFVIVTIAFMFMLQLLAENLVGITGGGGGLSFPIPTWSGDFFNTPYYYAMFLLAAVGLGALVAHPQLEVRPGLLAIRDDEDKALAVGRADARVQAHRFHHQRDPGRDDRRRLRLLRDIHLPAVRGRPAHRHLDGADGLPRRARDPERAGARRADPRAGAALARLQLRREPAVPGPLRRGVPGRDPAAAAGHRAVGCSSCSKGGVPGPDRRRRRQARAVTP